MQKSAYSKLSKSRRNPREQKEYGHLVTDIVRMVRAYRRKRHTPTQRAMDDYAPPGHD
jgi:hypothetical protein